MSRSVSVLVGFFMGSKISTMPFSIVTCGGRLLSFGSGKSLAVLQLPSGRRVTCSVGWRIVTCVTSNSSPSKSCKSVRQRRKHSS